MFFRANSENGEVCFDCAGVCGLHMSPSRGAPGATRKSRKKQAPQKGAHNTMFLHKKHRKVPKMESTWLR